MKVLLPAPFSPRSACTSPARASKRASREGGDAAETLREAAGAGSGPSRSVLLAAARAGRRRGRQRRQLAATPAASSAVISTQSGVIGSVRPGGWSGKAFVPISIFCMTVPG